MWEASLESSGGGEQGKVIILLLVASTQFLSLAKNMTCNKLTMVKGDVVALLCLTIHP